MLRKNHIRNQPVRNSKFCFKFWLDLIIIVTTDPRLNVECNNVWSQHVSSWVTISLSSLSSPPSLTTSLSSLSIMQLFLTNFYSKLNHLHQTLSYTLIFSLIQVFRFIISRLIATPITAAASTREKYYGLWTSIIEGFPFRTPRIFRRHFELCRL